MCKPGLKPQPVASIDTDTPSAPPALRRKPVVLVPACQRPIGRHPFHVAGRKYVEAVRLAGCMPLIVPSVSLDDIEPLLELADGVLLTGSSSNVHPRHFGQAVHDPALPLDTERDDWTLPMIPRVIALGMPLFAICRGLQETNVALGGSLHQAVQQVPGRMDHRSADAAPIDVQYGAAHDVVVQRGGVLADILAGLANEPLPDETPDETPRFRVNSLHGQGVDRLAAGLRAEAIAADGQIEAFSVEAASGFNLCVQWHPEWQAAENPVSLQLFAAFGAACAAYRRDRPIARGTAASIGRKAMSA